MIRNEQTHLVVKQRRNNVKIGGLMAGDPRESAVNRGAHAQE